MRNLIACLSLGLVVTMADLASAQQPRRVSTGKNQFTAGLSYRPQRPRVRKERTEADLLVYRQAAYQARQRAARIEARKWLGYSPLRPAAPVGWSLFADDYIPPIASTGGWYGRTDWLWMAFP